MRPLAGTRVVEWGDLVSAAYCARLLGGFGAVVDKLEPAAGDAARRHGPFAGDAPDPERSGLFVYLNSGKRSVLADPEGVAGQRVLHALLARADVFVTNRPAPLRRRLGLDAASLRARHPHLVIASLTVFGESGPLAGEPAETLDAYAMSGTAWVIGAPARPPLVLPYLQAEFQAGAHGASAVMMSLLARRRGVSGGREGEAIDIASADIFAAAAGSNGMIYLHHGAQRWERAGRRAYASGGPYPYVILPCKDGAVCLIGRSRHEWARLVEAMGNPAWTQNPRYQDLRAMGRDYAEEVDALIIPWLMRHTRAELRALAEKLGFPLGPLRTMAEVVAEPQFAHRGFLQDLPHAAGAVTVPGVPWRFVGETPPALQPAPRLGEHTAEVLRELGLEAA